MPPAAVQRRHFDPARDAHRWVFLLDEDAGVLYEIVAVRGMLGLRGQPAADAAVRILNVYEDLPEDPFEMLDRATWVPIEEATELAVVRADRHDA